jgi:hypothetical protein
MLGFTFTVLIPKLRRVLPTEPTLATAARSGKEDPLYRSPDPSCAHDPSRVNQRFRGGGDNRYRSIATATGMLILSIIGWVGSASAQETAFTKSVKDKATTEPLKSFVWDFGRNDDKNFDRLPDGWSRYTGIGFPKFVRGELVAKDPKFEQQVQRIDSWVMSHWQSLHDQSSDYPWLAGLPTPPSVSDFVVDRFLRVEMDGGQFKLQSPAVKSARKYQYQLSCDVMTEGLRYDSVRIEFVFLDAQDNEVSVRSSNRISGTHDWQPVFVKMMRPPAGVTQMAVRLVVERSEDGFEDIRGTIGFDNVRIDQYPQLRVTTDKSSGVYTVGTPIEFQASILGLSTTDASVNFHLMNHRGREIHSDCVAIQSSRSKRSTASRFSEAAADGGSAAKSTAASEQLDESLVDWRGPMLEPGFYRLIASIEGSEIHDSDRSLQPNPATFASSTASNPNRPHLTSETTFVVIDPSLQGPVHGPFGWTLPKQVIRQPPRELANWLTDLGVAWVKYPCWLGPEETQKAESVATMMGRLQEAGIHTVGMLDVPPENQIADYDVRGRRDLVASELFRDVEVWQPKLEPVMSRLTLKIRTWQIGGEGDFSFLGRPRVHNLIDQISKGLQGYGQPIDVAISWPWLEAALPRTQAGHKTSWQATCRSMQPPPQAAELDAFLSLGEEESRSNDPSTWILLDPIAKSRYDQDNRVRDLILRMATVRSHRVEAAFLSNPHHPDHGILKPDGRPDELLLPWRTTSRLIGNLRQAGSLRLRSGSQSMVFVGDNRAVMVLWSSEPTQEKIFLGDDVKQVDPWGRVTDLPVIVDPIQPHQSINVGPIPTFITGVDPVLLAFRMSVKTQPDQFDSLLGHQQKLSVILANPTRESLAGSMKVLTPEAWTIEDPKRSWETLAGRSTVEEFDVVLGNAAKIGAHELPIQFELDTVPPKLITVYREINVGPEGLLVKVTTRLLPSRELRVRIDITNRSGRTQAYNANLFAPGRQFQSSFIEIQPGESIRREIYWERGRDLVGKTMTLRAQEQDGDRVMNYSIDVNR